MSEKIKCSCIECKITTTVNNINKHIDSKACKRNQKKSALPKAASCSYCGRVCHNHNSWRNHERTCPKNENRIYKNGMTGKVPWNKGLDKTDSRIEKMSKSVSDSMKALYASGYRTRSQTQEYWTPERRKEKSDWKKELHRKNPELHPNRLLANNRSKMTYPERVAFDFLEKKGVLFEHQKHIIGFFVDFCIDDVIIEIDGEYWHEEGNEKDRIRDELLTAEGYTVFRIRSKEPIEERLEQILSVV